MTKVLVIIVSYNGMEWLPRCLASVAGKAPLFIVDNASDDGSPEFIRENYPDAVFIANKENTGFSQPNNLGLKYALENGYDYAYLMNQDAWLEEGALDKLLSAAGEFPEYGILSPLQMKAGGKEADDQFAKLLPEGYEGKRIVRVRRVMAAHSLIRLDAIKKVGFFNEALFPIWGQDDDCCQRMNFCGYKIGVVPSAVGIHDRAFRAEPMERIVQRNYYCGSLIRLCNPGKTLPGQFLYVCLFTLVKAAKYRSLLPFRYFGRIIENLPEIKRHRKPIK